MKHSEHLLIFSILFHDKSPEHYTLTCIPFSNCQVPNNPNIRNLSLAPEPTLCDLKQCMSRANILLGQDCRMSRPYSNHRLLCQLGMQLPVFWLSSYSMTRVSTGVSSIIAANSKTSISAIPPLACRSSK